MAIVNNLGGGGYVNTGQNIQATTGALQQSQQMAQQNLQDQQKNAFTYLQMLPELATQMGYAPEQMHLFLQEQAGQIQGQLGILGVKDPAGAFQSMVKETTLGQKMSGGTSRALDSKQGELAQQADELGLTGYAREEYIMNGKPGTSGTTETKVTGYTDAVAPTEVQIDSNSLMQKDPADIISQWDDNTKESLQRTIQHLNANKGSLSEGDTLRLSAINDLWLKNTDQTENIRNLQELYNRTTSDNTISKVETFVEPGGYKYETTFKDAGGYDSVEALNDYYRAEVPAETINQVVGAGAGNAEEKYQALTDEQKKTFVEGMTAKLNSGVSPSGREQYTLRRILSETGAEKQRTLSTTEEAKVSPLGDITYQVGGQASQPITETVTTAGTQGVQGLAGYSQGLFDKTQAQNPLAAQSVQPGEVELREQESQIEYRNALIQQAQFSSDAQLMTSFNALEEARLESNAKVQAVVVDQYFKELNRNVEGQLERAKTDEERTIILNRALEAIGESVKSYNYVADYLTDENGDAYERDPRGALMRKLFPNKGRREEVMSAGGLSPANTSGGDSSLQDLLNILG